MDLLDKVSKAKLIDNFIANVNNDNAHSDVEICAYELLGTEVESLPVIFSGELFIDCMLGYFESIENYELCAKIVENRTRIEQKLVPIKEFIKQQNININE